MKKLSLKEEAIITWCNYGDAINKAFNFINFNVDGEPLEKVLETNSEEKILKFIEYIKTQIEQLEKI